jgi:Zn-finger nucleic acid-binding protein
MKCPVCTNIELKMTDRQGVEIDYCPDCRGIWLDRGELDKIIEKSYSQASQPQQAVPQQTTQQPQYQHGSENNPFQKKHHDEHSPFYNKHHDKHYNEHGGGSHGQHQKKSWLSEIFD